jgi:guanylate kinase
VLNAYLNDLVYCAGPLSGNECEYIKNLNQMVETADKIEQLGVSTIIPGLDFIHGVIKGDREYFDYAKNSMTQMTRCDAVFLSEGWENSRGCKAELAMAETLNIPVFETLDALKGFVNRPKILCIVGESGSGKTYAADFIEKTYNIPMIRSYTTRPRRTLDEDGHTFISKEEFQSFSQEEMLVKTVWGEYEYCCLHEDIKENNTYVIDEKGYQELKFNYPHLYKMAGVRITRPREDRMNSVGLERVERDEDKFNLLMYCYDFIIPNMDTISVFEDKITNVVKTFFWRGE